MAADPPPAPPSAPHPGGRPSKLTPKRKKAILAALRAGLSRQGAAAKAGITYRTFAYWMAKGAELSEKPSPPDDLAFFQFFQAVNKAEASFEAKCIRSIERFTSGPNAEWRAAAFLLERRFRDVWGKLVRQEHSGPGGGAIPISYDPKNLTDEQLERISRGEPPGPPGSSQPGGGSG